MQPGEIVGHYRIPNGGLPLDRLLRIGIEVADALAAAQARGITQRDVKPGNVIVTPQGRAKVLDFGLAKLHEAEAAQASDDLTRMSSSSTITGEGKIVGTVAYMSPEQAEGKPVDPRSDIFSLGVVIHEMATGQKPFRGDTNVSVISAIIKDTPAPITDSNPNLPADLARIVRRCLAKDPERRYQTAQDLRNELEELKQDTASGVITTVRRSHRWHSSSRHRRDRRRDPGRGGRRVVRLRTRSTRGRRGCGHVHARSSRTVDQHRDGVDGGDVARRPIRRPRERRARAK